jgi:hypothetical protein
MAPKAEVLLLRLGQGCVEGECGPHKLARLGSL